ncbi:Coenzyme F420 hydrogenase/dehydrogenase, beta subunit C-terminal domain [Citrobacter amalonaticus]|uniref:Coenzyme F420 hydrogenase/dehydrogenase, beta subunit C-terminal domain n=1 Tax=Citrobacter amalonaticus TaxID=35703 RepID=UPI001904E86C|nr:Coenzyme F420 hydrogenase/dehydrogenase, beta subunit C-terminal domain [Citrobacter amalonaticus]MBJ9317060.1 Coenzyme F420 hydrogenase/dehydrogenase, beta subunit C-terminal domain [Citrobacter amalonaticus]HCE8749888.1 Coenzyme F420 hydrogenase/dehydrogenase, beta subunit C-terminal domain [Citrobacter amalonaticus]
MSIQNVIKNNYCIGCGACSYKNNKITLEWDEYGILKPQGNIDELDDEICPFSSHHNETSIADSLYGEVDSLSFHQKVGYYHEIFAGYASEGNYRENASSGGLTTWLLVELMSKKLIDGVIHVGASKSNEQLYTYSISESIEDIKLKTRSQYYPTKFDNALENIDSRKKYAVVGIPCYIKAIRLLCKKNDELNISLKYFIGIFCGHLKTKAFSELLSWQQGILPSNLRHINFRVKNSFGTASRYSIRVTSSSGVERMAQTGHLYGTDWGLGLFKPEACEWCDDIAAEVADVVFGDAWLPKYVSDPKGTNIVLSRNLEISTLLKEAAGAERLFLEHIDVDDVIHAQAGNYRHRQEGLLIRIKDADLEKKWHPQKRDFLLPTKVDENRKEIYRIRKIISSKSHAIFFEAKKKNNLMFFFYKMAFHEVKYRILTKSLIKNSIKHIYFIANYLKRKGVK